MTNTLTISREQIEAVAKEMDRLGYGHHEHHAESILHAIMKADPAVERQAQPVYQSCNGVDGWIDVDLLRYTARSLDPEEYETRILFTSPPAPVAVVMPEPVGQVVEFGKGLKEVSWIKGKMPVLGSNLYTSTPPLLLPARRTADDFQSKNAQYDCADALADTWNACLDKVKEMNR